jgi:uncharacterized protein
VTKPSDHPDFFRLPPPAGASRESSIELDSEGRFWHEGQPVTHPALHRAFATWLRRHPDNGRYILSNGYDWTYVAVRGTPFFVEGILLKGDQPHLLLSDGSEEPWLPSTFAIDSAGAVYARVKFGAFEAKFTPSAQLQLAPWVADAGSHAALEVEGRLWVLPERGQDPNSCSG